MSRLKSILRNLRLILSREITDQIGEVETRLSRRADDYEHAVDARLDERFNALHQLIGERFAELHFRFADVSLFQVGQPKLRVCFPLQVDRAKIGRVA